MRGMVILGLLALILGCEKKAEPTTDTPPSGWSPPPTVSPPTGSKVEPGK